MPDFVSSQRSYIQFAYLSDTTKVKSARGLSWGLPGSSGTEGVRRARTSLKRRLSETVRGTDGSDLRLLLRRRRSPAPATPAARRATVPGSHPEDGAVWGRCSFPDTVSGVAFIFLSLFGSFGVFSLPSIGTKFWSTGEMSCARDVIGPVSRTSAAASWRDISKHITKCFDHRIDRLADSVVPHDSCWAWRQENANAAIKPAFSRTMCIPFMSCSS